jgi:hypothetical protein
MAQGNGTLAVYVDSRATEPQRAALEAIFSGNAGGPPSLLSGMVAHRLPTKAAAIDFTSDGRTFKLSMTGIAEITVQGIPGAGNQVVWLDNVGHPFSSRLAAAKALQSEFHDHSLNFENSGRNGHFSPIRWSNG